MNTFKRLLNRFFGLDAGLDARGMYSDAFAIAWPAALEGALLSIIGTVDTIMVKAVDKYAIAAINLTSQPRMILLILAQALCVGTTAMVSRRKGENDRAGANDVLSLSMLLTTGVGIIISLVGYFLAEPIIKLAGGDGDTTVMAVNYFKIISLGLIFSCWNLCLCAALRATGNTRITMVTNITANLVNVVMNYCLIGGHFGFPALGERGAAIATVIGGFVGFLIALYMVTIKGEYLKLKIRLFGFEKRSVTGLLKVGASSMAESAALRVGFFINNRIIAGVGADALTANTIVSQVSSLSFCLGDGVATAGATLVGVSLGEKRPDKAKGFVRVCMGMGYIVSISLIIGLFFSRRALSGLFTDDPGIIAGASLAFVVLLFGIIPQNSRVVYSGCLRGAGDVKYVAMCSLISVSIIRPALTYILCHPVNALLPGFELSYTAPWIAFVIDAFIRTWLLTRRINSGKYLDIKL